MLWKVIRYWPLIKGLLDTIKEILHAASENKKIDKRLLKVLFDTIQEMLRKKVYDIPGVDEDAIADWLQKIEDKLFPEEKK